MHNHYMQIRNIIEDNRFFGGHSNPEQHLRPRMFQFSDKKMPFL